jgi:hypothetical protein
MALAVAAHCRLRFGDLTARLCFLASDAVQGTNQPRFFAARLPDFFASEAFTALRRKAVECDFAS